MYPSYMSKLFNHAPVFALNAAKWPAGLPIAKQMVPVWCLGGEWALGRRVTELIHAQPKEPWFQSGSCDGTPAAPTDPS